MAPGSIHVAAKDMIGFFFMAQMARFSECQVCHLWLTVSLLSLKEIINKAMCKVAGKRSKNGDSS